MEKAAYNWSADSVRLIVTPVRSTPSIYFQVQEIGAFQTTAGYFTEREHLNSFLIVYTIGGEGRLTYLGEEYRLREGQCFSSAAPSITCMKRWGRAGIFFDCTFTGRTRWGIIMNLCKTVSGW